MARPAESREQACDLDRVVDSGSPRLRQPTLKPSRPGTTTTDAGVALGDQRRQLERLEERDRPEFARGDLGSDDVLPLERSVENGQAGADHLLIRGLLQTLPEVGAVWPDEERREWAEAATAAFNLIYKRPAPKDGG